MKRIVVAAAFMALAACAGMSPQSPAQAVYLAETDYAAALSLAVKYKQLPACDAAASPVCAKPEIVAALRKADGEAYAALHTAQDAVRTPGFGQDKIDTAVTLAKSAMSAFTTLAQSLGVK